jgi:hypothetical protein
MRNPQPSGRPNTPIATERTTRHGLQIRASYRELGAANPKSVNPYPKAMTNILVAQIFS